MYLNIERQGIYTKSTIGNICEDWKLSEEPDVALARLVRIRTGSISAQSIPLQPIARAISVLRARQSCHNFLKFQEIAIARTRIVCPLILSHIACIHCMLYYISSWIPRLSQFALTNWRMRRICIFLPPSFFSLSRVFSFCTL